jgi:hypothetical protein
MRSLTSRKAANIISNLPAIANMNNIDCHVYEDKPLVTFMLPPRDAKDARETILESLETLGIGHRPDVKSLLVGMSENAFTKTIRKGDSFGLTKDGVKRLLQQGGMNEAVDEVAKALGMKSAKRDHASRMGRSDPRGTRRQQQDRKR